MPILTHEERVGTLLADKYRLESILGRGGMGAVFAGTHEWTGRRVAVKLLNYEYASNPEMATRFLREAKTAATLKHPNVVDVLDMGAHADGTVYLVLERLDGVSLSDLLIERGFITPLEAYDYLIPMMRALSYAHKKAVVHRDLKPDNIFISEEPSGGTVPKLLDFGIAKVMESGPSSTVTGAVLGTPQYMSPEQTTGEADIGPGTDVWSMGVVWYECLSGVLPFDGPNPTSIIIAISNGKYEPLAGLKPNLPRALTDAITRAVTADRRQRFPDMAAFTEALLAVRPEVERASAAAPDPHLQSSRSSRLSDIESGHAPTIAASSPGLLLEDPVEPATLMLIAPRPEPRNTGTPTNWVERKKPGRSTASRPGVVAMIAGLVAIGVVGIAVAAWRGLARGPGADAAATTAARATTAMNPIQPPTPGGAPSAVDPAPAAVNIPSPAASLPSAPATASETPTATQQHPRIAARGRNERLLQPATPAGPAPMPGPAAQPVAPTPVALAPPPSAPTRAATPAAPPAADPVVAPAPESTAPRPRRAPAPPPARDPNAPLTDYEMKP